MKRLISAALCAVCTLVLPACAPDQAKIAVTYATMRYIDEAGPEQAVTRAARVAALANETLNALEGDGFELGRFSQQILARLPSDMLPSDRALAVALISMISDELQLRIGPGSLTPETRVQAKKVVQWIMDATAYYERSS